MLERLLAPIAGADLSHIAQKENYFDLLFPEFVAETVLVAGERIRDLFGQIPTPDGNNIEGIQTIRRILFKAAGGYPKVNAFMILAPHTHWEERSPVIYHLSDKDGQYSIGTTTLHPTEMYTPVSFVFSKFGLLPYEWVDSSILMNQNEWMEAIQILKRINAQVFPLNYPLGISIDFRFKYSLFDTIHSTTEFSRRFDERIETKIVRNTDLDKYDIDDDFEQIGWHPVSDETMDLTKEELALLQALKKNSLIR